MAELTEAEPVGPMADATKLAEKQRYSPDTSKDKVEHLGADDFDAKPADESKDVAEKEKKGSVRDYLVSAQQDRHCSAGRVC